MMEDPLLLLPTQNPDSDDCIVPSNVQHVSKIIFRGIFSLTGITLLLNFMFIDFALCNRFYKFILELDKFNFIYYAIEYYLSMIGSYFYFVSISLLSFISEKSDYKRKNVITRCIINGSIKWAFFSHLNVREKPLLLFNVQPTMALEIYMIFCVLGMIRKLLEVKKSSIKKSSAKSKDKISYINSWSKLMFFRVLLYAKIIQYGITQGFNVATIVVDVIDALIFPNMLNLIRNEKDINKKEMIQTLNFHAIIESVWESPSDEGSEEEIDNYLDTRRSLNNIMACESFNTMYTEEVFNVRPNSEFEVISKKIFERTTSKPVRISFSERFRSFLTKHKKYGTSYEQLKFDVYNQEIYSRNAGEFLWCPLNDDQLAKEITFVRCVPFLFEANIEHKTYKASRNIQITAPRKDLLINKKDFNFFKSSTIDEISDNAFNQILENQVQTELLIKPTTVNTIIRKPLIAAQVRGRMRII